MTEPKIQNIIKLIDEETEDKVATIKAEAKEKAEQNKRKAFLLLKDQLDKEFERKREAEEVRVKTEKSRTINQARLDVQQKRSDMIATLREEVKAKLVARLQDKQARKEALKNLIVQGLTRLLEKNIIVRCRQEDADLINGILTSCADEFNTILRQELKRENDFKVKLEVSPQYLEKGESEIGGVIMSCHSNRIVYKNTFDMRLDLCIQQSIPDIRAGIFGAREEVKREYKDRAAHH